MSKYYESIPVVIEAVQYNGTNVAAMREMLSRQEPPGRVTIAGSAPTFLRSADRPDRPLLSGDWLVLESDNWVTLMSNDAFQRRMRPLGTID